MGNVLRSFNDDTICAIATAMTDAGIGIIRVSGNDAVSICDKLYISGKKERDLTRHEPNTIKYGYIVDGDRIVDEVMISFMKAPHSYTCEDVIEINSHGGMLVMNEILSLLLKNGCRLAEPGEFTKRAFLNGRIDLTKAEAVMDIIEAQSSFALESSRAQLSGNIYDEVVSLRKDILYQMAYIESALDDPENYDLTGFSSEECMYLYTSDSSLNFKGILTASMMLATLGAVMDTGMSIASSVNEFFTLNPEMTPKELFISGMNVGKDIIGTMANTLILVYLGSSLPLVLLSQNIDLQKFFNLNQVVTEITSAIIGSIAIVICVPITAFVTAYLMKKKNENETNIMIKNDNDILGD